MTIAIGLIARDKVSHGPVTLATALAQAPENAHLHVIDVGYAGDIRAEMDRVAAGFPGRVAWVPAPRFANTNQQWNRFVESADAPFLLALENDVRLEPGCIDGLLAALAGGSWDVVLPVIHEATLGNVHYQPVVSEFVQHPDGRLESRVVRRPKPGYPRPEPVPNRVVHMEKHCFLTTSANARTLGPLDEQMHCRTDIDISLMCHARGLQIGVVPTCHAVFQKAPAHADAELFGHRWDIECAVAANARLAAKWNLANYKPSIGFVTEMRQLLEQDERP